MEEILSPVLILRVMANTVRQKIGDSAPPTVPQRTRSARKHLAFTAKIVGSLVLLLLLFRKLELPDLVVALRRADGLFVGLALVTGSVFLLIRVYKWFYIVRPHLVSPNFWSVLVSYMFGLGIGILTPGRVGEIARIAKLGVTERSGAAALFLFDKFVDVLIVFSMALFGTYFLLQYRSCTLVFSVLLGGALVGVFCMPQIHGVIQRVLKRYAFGHRLDRILKFVVLLDPRTIAITILLTLTSYIICIFQVYFILRAFCAPKLSYVFAVHPLVMVTNVLPITFGGLGLREGASVLLYAKYGIPEEYAFWSGFLVFALTTLLYGVLGIVLINFKDAKKQRDLERRGGM